MNLVGVTLFFHDKVSRCNFVDKESVIVVEANASNVGAIRGDRDGLDSTHALGELESLFERSINSTPCEHDGCATNLSGNSHLSSVANLDAHDIVGVSDLVGGVVLGGIVDLATTEELLGVGGLIEDNTESSSHVDSLSVGVVVNVLL